LASKSRTSSKGSLIKVLLLADPNSVHTIKWATSLAYQGIEIVIFGLGNLNVNNYLNIVNIKVEVLDENISNNEGTFSKIKYLKAVPKVKKIITSYKPDIIHSHYASSYGLLGALSGFQPFIISVWGSDIFSFPKKSFLHKEILKYNLRKAKMILSTSHVMASETTLYTDKNITVTPFGIDLNQFKPMKVKSLFDIEDIVIGTVKTLEEKYGIEYLIRAFKILHDKYLELPLKLLIVGGGSLEPKLIKLVYELQIESKTIFTGQVVFQDVPKYHNMLSVSVSVSISNSESFGVAIIEASACEIPVVVSNVGGLPEVVSSEETGLVVPLKNSEETANAIEKLILDEKMRTKMGKAGRKRVENLYNWTNNMTQMIQIYEDIIQ